MKFNQRLKELRNSKRITQEKIAQALNIKRSTYAKYETGENQPDHETLQLLADFFNVSTDYLLGRSDKKMIVTKNNPPIEVFRKRLKECREEKELTYGDLAEVASVTPTYIEKLETEATELPGLRTFYAIADKLGVTPDYLGGFTNDKQGRSPDTPKPKELTDLLNKDIMFHGVPLDDEERQKILAVMEAMFWDAKAKNKRKK